MSDSKKYGFMMLGIVELVVGIYMRKAGEAGLAYVPGIEQKNMQICQISV